MHSRILCRSQSRLVCLSAPNVFQKHSVSIVMGAVLSLAYGRPCAMKTMGTTKTYSAFWRPLANLTMTAHANSETLKIVHLK